MNEHPRQPIEIDQHGVARFKENSIVSYLVDWCARYNRRAGYPPVSGPAPDLNELASMTFSDEDREQLAQLIGYSVSGFGELHYVSPDAVAWADAEAERAVTPC